MLEKIVYDITKFTALDWEDHLSAVLWLKGCNMRCPYCHNADVVFGEAHISKKEVLSFLQNRIGRLEAVILSGGECTLYKNLPTLAEEIKKLGYKIKIDTNGTNPAMLKEMVKKNLVDFISIDYKAPRIKYTKITKNNNFDKFEESLDFLIKSMSGLEIRTTVHTDLMDENDINHIIEDLCDKGFSGTYYIQNYIHTDKTIEKLPEFPREINKSLINHKIPIKFRN